MNKNAYRRKGLLAILLIATLPLLSRAQPPTVEPDTLAQVQPPLLKEVGIDQRLGETLPLEVTLTNEAGETAPLGTYFNERPVLLALVYYECPRLCNLVMQGLVSALRPVSFNAGEEFDVVIVSIDPRETPELARSRKAAYVRQYGREQTANGWHFLTGSEEAIHQIAQAVGFRYTYDAATGEYAHAAGIMLLTPQGKLSKYLLGIEYSPRDIRLALIEAADDKIGSPVDQFWLYCFHYDPAIGRYGIATMNVLRLAGVATVAILGTYVLAMLLRERNKLRDSSI